MIPLWRIGFFAALAVISWLALTPKDQLPPIHLWDKASHVLAFATLATLAGRSWPTVKLRQLGIPLLAYGFLIEMLQLWIPGREFSWLDLLADALGICCYVLAAQFATNRPQGPRSALYEYPDN